MEWIVALAISYLLGSIPTAYLLVRRIKGADIRTLGSGNVGATNVLRVAGKGPAALTYLLDGFKGWLAVAAVPLFCRQFWPETPEGLRIGCFFMAVAGHSWPVFLGFRGGKGVAVSSGALIGLNPVVFGLAFAVWALVFAASRWVSLASGAAACALPGLMFWLHPDRLESAFTVVLSLVVLYRHRSNWARILRGTEPRTKFS